MLLFATFPQIGGGIAACAVMSRTGRTARHSCSETWVRMGVEAPAASGLDKDEMHRMHLQ